MTGSLKVAWQRLQNLSGSIISLFWCKAKVEATRKGFVRHFDRAAVREFKQKQWKDPEGAKLSSMLNGKKGWVTNHTCRCGTACVNQTGNAFFNWENWEDLGEPKTSYFVGSFHYFRYMNTDFLIFWGGFCYQIAQLQQLRNVHVYIFFIPQNSWELHSKWDKKLGRFIPILKVPLLQSLEPMHRCNNWGPEDLESHLEKATVLGRPFGLHCLLSGAGEGGDDTNI